MLKTRHLMNCIKNEIDILRSLNNSNINKLHEIFEGEKNIYLVLEYLEGGDLSHMISSEIQYPEKDLKLIMKSLFNALLYLQSKNILHRDLKPENIMFRNKNDLSSLSIIDFGLSIRHEQIYMEEPKSGTPGYIAPEILSDSEWSMKGDLFSIGCIFHQLLTGKPAFIARCKEDLLTYNRIAKIDFERKHWDNVNLSAKDLCMKLLAKNSRERIDLEMALNHPWLQFQFSSESALTLKHSNTTAVQAKEDFQKNDKKCFEKAKIKDRKGYIPNKVASYPLHQFPTFSSVRKGLALTAIIISIFNLIDLKSEPKSISSIKSYEASKQISQENFLKLVKVNLSIQENNNSNLNFDIKNKFEVTSETIKIERTISQNNMSLVKIKDPNIQLFYRKNTNALLHKQILGLENNKCFECQSIIDKALINQSLMNYRNSVKEMTSQNSNLSQIKGETFKNELTLSHLKLKHTFIPDPGLFYMRNMTPSRPFNMAKINLLTKIYDVNTYSNK